MNRLFAYAANAFPFWVSLGGISALFYPDLFTWFSGSWIVWGLAAIMLGMGLTLDLDDFKKVLTMPRIILIGFLAQYGIMPFLGWAIAKGMHLPPAFAAGLILVACCPGGTASNVVTYIARAHVALSVLMTLCSTLAAVLLTPLLTQWLAGAYVPVDGWGLFLSTLQVVLAPVLIGLVLHHSAPKLVRCIIPVSPLIAVLTITMICASIIGQSAEAIKASGFRLILAVLLLHSCGFGLGYLFARLFGYDKAICRTVSIEVGMQNSGLGVVLARKHFADPLTAVPCAISSVCHSVIGSFLAGIWRLGKNSGK